MTTKQSIVFIGASESSGYGLPKGASYVDKFSKLIGQKNKTFIVKNISYPGAATANGKEMLSPVLKGKEPCHSIFISLGLSDVVYGVSTEQIHQNLFDMIRLIQSKNRATRIYIMEGEIFQYHVLPDLPTHESIYYERYKAIYNSLKSETEVTIYPFLMKALVGHSEYFLPDLVHPNEKATTKIAGTLYTFFSAENSLMK